MKKNPREATDDGQITENLRSELRQSQLELEGLQRRMQHLEGLFDHVADAIFVADLDGRIVEVNEAACRLLDYEKAILLQLHPWDFVTSASCEEILELIQNMKPNEALTIPRTYRTRTGVFKQMDLRLTRCDLAGRDLIVVSSRDVTEQRQLQDRLQRSEQNLAEGQRLTKTGSWVLDFHTGNTDWSVETCRIFGFPDPPPSPHYSEFRARVRPEDRDAVDRGLRESFDAGEPRPLKYIFVLPDGTRKNIETISQPVRDESGKVIKLMGTVMDVTKREWTEALLAGEKRILEMLAQENPLAAILDAICRLAEDLTGDILVSILLTSPDGKSLRLGAAPSLPERYNHAIDGGLIGPSAGSCGTAAYRKEPVIVSDIATDPLWDHYREVALLHELRACWSTPILSTTREVLGTFALYARKTGSPQTEPLAIVQQFVHLASIAIERTHAQEATRAAEKFARGQADALTEALDALVRESSADQIVEHVLRTITRQLDAHSCSVWLREEATGLMAFEFALEDGKFKTKADQQLARVSPSLRVQDVWPWPEVFRTGKPYLLEDIREGQEFPWRTHVVAQGVISILIVPMLIAGEVAGVIGIRFTQRRTFRAEEMDLAQALANQAMLAMQMTRLSAQSRQSAVMMERNRMARDIHDTLAQGFTGVIVQLEAAADATSRGLAKEAERHCNRAVDLARDSLKEARRSVQALRPQALQEKHLCDALKELIQKMTAGTTLLAEFALQGQPCLLAEEWEENLLRIGQEILTNALRHAQASEFKVHMVFAADELCLDLRDNGRGFDPARKHDGFGLLGIRERVESMGGVLTIESTAGTGTKALIALPFTKMPPLVKR